MTVIVLKCDPLATLLLIHQILTIITKTVFLQRKWEAPFTAFCLRAIIFCLKLPRCTRGGSEIYELESIVLENFLFFGPRRNHFLLKIWRVTGRSRNSDALAETSSLLVPDQHFNTVSSRFWQLSTPLARSFCHWNAVVEVERRASLSPLLKALLRLLRHQSKCVLHMWQALLPSLSLSPLWCHYTACANMNPSIFHISAIETLSSRNACAIGMIEFLCFLHLDHRNETSAETWHIITWPSQRKLAEHATIN